MLPQRVEQDVEPCRILVVDDDFILNQLFSSYLLAKGFDVVSAESLAAAEEVLRSRADIDLVLLDYQLEDGFGIELLAEARLTSYASTPSFIMISVNEDADFLEQCFEKGIADYVIKPVNLSLLALKVRSIFNAIKLQRLTVAQNQALAAYKYNAEQEASIAKFTYEYLLRQNIKNIPGIQVESRSHSAFSGDIALAKVSPTGDVYFLLADATGHGLSAAITIMPMVSVFNTMVSKGFHLHQIITEMNHKLVSDTPDDRFVAAVIFELNPTKHTLSVWNGAMPAAYWVNDGRIAHRFESLNMALGILDDDLFEANVETIALPGAGFLFACSDGLIEQENASEQQFSKARLEQLLEQKQNMTQAIFDELEAHTGAGAYTDDVSLCFLRPDLLFKEELILDRQEIGGGLKDEAGEFTWRLRVSGGLLETCEVAPLCNSFLQSLKFNQQYCQKVFSLIAEMVSNALDHGILGLSSELKEQDMGFLVYMSEREQRLQQLTADDFVEIELEWVAAESTPYLKISCLDSGAGYLPKSRAPTAELQFSGRGLDLIRQLARSVIVTPPGNQITAII